MSAYSDEQLVSDVLEDSPLAFGQLVKQYQHHVLRTIASIIKDEQAAQDVAQEAFLAVWNDLAKLKERPKLGRWLTQIAINLSKNWLRNQRKHRENRVPLDENAVVLTQELRYQRETLRRQIWEAIDELASEQREAVILHYISGYSYKEIGEMLIIPLSTITGRLQAARNQLRKEFLDMVSKLQLEIDSTLHGFLKEHAKANDVSVEGLILRLIERYKRDTDRPGIGIRKVDDWGYRWRYLGGPSPDGRYFCFTRWDGNLTVRDLTTGENRELSNDANRMRFCGPSTWSPDGKWIAYSWNNEGHSELRIVGLDGSKPRVVYTPEARELGVVPWDWSQDSKFILGRQGESGIVLVSVMDGAVQTLKSLEKPWRENWEGASLSPDGRYVAYARTMEKNGALDVFLLATDSSEEETYLEGHANSHDYRPVWTPDGKSIVSVCNREPAGNSSLWLTRVADGKQMAEPQLVMKCAGGIEPHRFTREGSLYYSVDSAALADIYVVSLNMETGEVGKPTRLRCEGNNGDPVWSPDGKSLAYISRRYSPKTTHQTVLVIRSMETGKEREIHAEAVLSIGRLGAKNTLEYSLLRWSPEGDSILCSTEHVSGTMQHNLIDAQTGHITPILETNSGMGVEYPEWSRDGKTLFYIRRYADKDWGFFSIVAHELATGEERELYTGGWSWSCLMVSPDGRGMFFYDEGQTMIKVIPTAGGDARLLHVEPLPSHVQNRGGGPTFPFTAVYPVTWTPDGRHLLFIKARILSYDEQTHELWRIPAEGGDGEKLREVDKQLYTALRQGSFHPDGQQIAFARSDGESQHELWVMENLLTTFAADK